MRNNIEKLEEWYKCISNFEKLKFSDARQLFIEIQNEIDDREKTDKRNKLIEGTLYVVYKFINSNNLCSLNSATYDMDDVISVCNGLWIDAIDDSKLLDVDKFSQIFNNSFYSELTEGLISTKHLIYENINLSIEQFIELFFEFVKQKNNNYNLDYNKFLKVLLSNDKYALFINKLFYYNDNLSYVYTLFESTFEYLNEDDKFFLTLSKTKLDKLKYILINNGLEILRENINNVKDKDFTDNVVEKMYYQQVYDFIFNSNVLNETEKNIIKRRYGFDNLKCYFLEEVALEDGVTRERIRQKECKALRKLRSSKELKNLIKV